MSGLSHLSLLRLHCPLLVPHHSLLVLHHSLKVVQMHLENVLPILPQDAQVPLLELGWFSSDLQTG